MQTVFQHFMTFGHSAKVPLALSVVRNLFPWFDSELTMNKHVKKLYAVQQTFISIAFVEYRSNCVKSEKLVHAFIASRVDCCNSLLYDLPVAR